ncbi:MAG: hypothetical protein R2911_31385 [Caldilineaceae bacterium]
MNTKRHTGLLSQRHWRDNTSCAPAARSTPSTMAMAPAIAPATAAARLTGRAQQHLAAPWPKRHLQWTGFVGQRNRHHSHGASGGYKTEYTYESDSFRLSTLKYPDNEVVTYAEQQHGAAHQLTTSSGSATLVDTVKYDEAGRLTSMKFPNGGNLYRSQTYWPWVSGSSSNSNGRLTKSRWGPAAALLTGSTSSLTTTATATSGRDDRNNIMGGPLTPTASATTRRTGWQRICPLDSSKTCSTRAAPARATPTTPTPDDQLRRRKTNSFKHTTGPDSQQKNSGISPRRQRQPDRQTGLSLS